MADYEAIVIGAGHNGLTAAALLQRAGMHTLCLDSKLYAGGMASTVELFDGYHFEIAGSLQFPTSAKVSDELGLDDLPTIDSDVMSVSLRGIGDDPVVYYTDPMKMLTHLSDVHGAEAVNGMANLMAWSMGPTRALGRFEAGLPPKTIDEVYACAQSEFERSAITDMLFGSVTTYRGPATPGSAAALAFGMAVHDENAELMTKLRGASERAAGRGPRALLPRRSSRQLSANALRPRRHADLRCAVRHAQGSRVAVGHRRSRCGSPSKPTKRTTAR